MLLKQRELNQTVYTSCIEAGYTEIVSRIIAGRRKSFDRNIFEFSLDAIQLAMTMAGVPEAVNRIIKAIQNKEKILIFTDYDVDGCTSMVILYKALHEVFSVSQSNLLKLTLSEQELYMYSQAGVTLFRDLLRQEFNEELTSYMPERVLPVSTEPPRDLHTMVEAGFKEIQQLLKPNSRRQIEAKSKLKALAIVEASLEGVRSQSGEFELRKMVREVKNGNSWQDIFPGVASLQLETTGTGINVDIRITKKDGEAVHLVPEGTPGATVLAVKRVNELDYYNLGAKKLADKVGLTVYKLLALVWHLKIQDSDEYFKILKIGSQVHKRYSKKAYEAVVAALEDIDIDDVINKYKNR